MFRLQFSPDQIRALSARYWQGLSASDKSLETEIIQTIAPRVRQRGCYDRGDFLVACRWKGIWKNILENYCARNSEADIRRLTGQSLTPYALEADRIQELRSLHGVDWAMASVLLHFGTGYQYPILDFRALWSCGMTEQPPAKLYSDAFWQDYTAFCRETARQGAVDLRTLDQAAWQYSKENQPKDRGRVDPHESDPAPLSKGTADPLLAPVQPIRATGFKSGNSYYLSVGAKQASERFEPDWKVIHLEMDGCVYPVRLSGAFRTTSPELRGKDIQNWLEHHGLAPWPQRHPPKLVLIPLGGNRFRLEPPQDQG